MGGEAGDGWFATERVFDGITRLWEPRVHRFFRGNVWLVEGGERDLVIDFAMGIRSVRAALPRDPGKPVVALATHVHVDHVGCFHEFEERLGHSLEAPFYADMADEATLAHLVREMPDSAGEEPPPGWDHRTYRLEPAPLTRIVEEGDVIDLGGTRLRVLHLPGHSPGSIGLLDEDRRLLFSGDAIYEGNILDTLPGSSVPDYLATMRRLAGLDVDVVCGGHNGAISAAQMREIAARYIAGRETEGPATADL